MEKKQIASNKQVKLEIEMILNRKLFQNKVIDRQIYEEVQDELLKESNQIEDVNISNDNDEEFSKDINIESDNIPKFYLDPRNGEKPNFAFVPETIFVKLKSNSISEIINNRIYKQDDEEKKGIIVRKDQFMKLSLSKERQDGVLKEAKVFRIKQAKKSRQQLQNVE